MRRFELHRDEDVSGVSGTGVVAEGVAFGGDGPVALRWTSEWPTSVVFHDRGIESLEAVHGHNGRTRIVWLDDENGDSYAKGHRVNGEPVSWAQKYERAHADYLRENALANVLSDLDRCVHGRHEGDVCSSCGGPSVGNKLLPEGAVIGAGLSGVPIVQPPGTERRDPEAWYRS